jgi:hypothetical protein
MGMVYKIRAWVITEETTADFHVIGDNFWDALGYANDYLDEKLGKNNWDILTFKAKPQLNIVNYMNEEPLPHYTGDCSCPYDTFESTPPEKQIITNCPVCDNEIKVSDTNWLTIRCLNCYQEIKREDVYKNEDGVWFVKSEGLGKEE